MSAIIYELFILLAAFTTFIESKGDEHKVQCSEDQMNVDIMLPDRNLDASNVYLVGMKGFRIPRCQPIIKDQVAQFQLPLNNFYECGVTRVVHKSDGKKVFYHQVIIETPNQKNVVSVKCIVSAPYNVSTDPHSISRRDVLPIGFEEPIELDILTTYEKKAPEPMLSVAVKQANGELVTGELNVSPGTQLTMEIYLDKTSAPVYGLGVSYMQVTDTKSQEETIIFNGCSVDPFLFENFNTADGDFLNAKFRAFKFPDSTYVQFRVTVIVCVDRCTGIPCSNGQIGYGRRKRDVSASTDPNKVYEISTTTFIRVDGDTKEELAKELENLKLANQKLQRNSRGSLQGVHDDVSLTRRSSSDNDEPIHIQAQVESTASTIMQMPAVIISIAFVVVTLLTNQRY